MLSNRIVRTLFVALALAIGANALYAQGTTDDWRSQIPFQGKLTSATGSALTGSYDFTFDLFTEPTLGTSVWNEQRTGITVQNGFYSLRLGTVNPLTAETLMSARYLEIKVRRNGTANFDTLSPRVTLSSVPFSISAGSLGGLTEQDVATVDHISGSVVANGIVAPNAGGNAGGSAGGDLGGSGGQQSFITAEGDLSGAPRIVYNGSEWQFSNDGVNFVPVGGAQADQLFVKEPESNVITPMNPTDNIHTAGTITADSGAMFGGNITANGSDFYAPDFYNINLQNMNGPAMLHVQNVGSEFGVDLDVSGGIGFTGSMRVQGFEGNTGQVLMSTGSGSAPAWSDIPVSGGDFMADGSVAMTGPIMFAESQTFDAGMLFGMVSDANLPSDLVRSNQLDGFATTLDLQNYALASDLFNFVTADDLSNYALASDLQNYATLTDLSSYALASDLQNYATLTDLSSYALASDLQNYATLTDLSSYATQTDIQGFLVATDLDGYLFVGSSQDIAIVAQSAALGTNLAGGNLTLGVGDGDGSGDDGRIQIDGVTTFMPVTTPLTSNPGDVYFDGATLLLFDGLNWVDLTQAGGGASSIVTSYGASADFFLSRANGSEGLESAVIAGENLGQIGFGGFDGTTFTAGNASIVATATENYSGSGTGTALDIYTTPNGSTVPQSRITVSSEGGVGVNNPSPLFDLDVLGDINFTGQLLQNGSPFGGGGGGSLWTDNLGDISYTTGNVGVGTSAPGF
ncbi:MAG: hypothetical protein NUW37_15765, partial [Planctomycetes bacterium]|nr:hypothetical protein [Planctomycetota bacterium]